MKVKNKTSSFKMVNTALTHSLHGNYFKTTRRMQNKFTTSPENEKIATNSEGNGRRYLKRFLLLHLHIVDRQQVAYPLFRAIETVKCTGSTLILAK